MERGSAQRSAFKGRERAIVSQASTGTVSTATLGKLHGDGGRLRFPRERIDTTLDYLLLLLLLSSSLLLVVF